MSYCILIPIYFLGTIFGSFYNVVGYRVPKGESLIRPPSHCTKCNHRLTALDLIPVFSYILLRGRCRHCGEKISCFYPIFEFLTGILFAACYLVFGFSFECLMGIFFISMLLIIIISDYQTMIIPDSVLIVFSSLIMLTQYFSSGIEELGSSLLNGVISFIFMLFLKLFGDFLFKKESMGGGDIKLLAVFGIVLGFKMSIISVFLAAIIGLPISLIIIKNKTNHEIPFGPFLAISAILIFLLNINFDDVLKLFGV